MNLFTVLFGLQNKTTEKVETHSINLGMSKMIYQILADGFKSGRYKTFFDFQFSIQELQQWAKEDSNF